MSQILQLGKLGTLTGRAVAVQLSFAASFDYNQQTGIFKFPLKKKMKRTGSRNKAGFSSCFNAWVYTDTDQCLLLPARILLLTSVALWLVFSTLGGD